MQTPALGCVPNETCGLSYAPIFWCPYMFISGDILLNLFVLVIINEFNKYYLSDDNLMDLFKTNL